MKITKINPITVVWQSASFRSTSFGWLWEGLKSWEEDPQPFRVLLWWSTGLPNRKSLWTRAQCDKVKWIKTPGPGWLSKGTPWTMRDFNSPFEVCLDQKAYEGLGSSGHSRLFVEECSTPLQRPRRTTGMLTKEDLQYKPAHMPIRLVTHLCTRLSWNDHRETMRASKNK